MEIYSTTCTRGFLFMINYGSCRHKLLTKDFYIISWKNTVLDAIEIGNC